MGVAEALIETRTTSREPRYGLAAGRGERAVRPARIPRRDRGRPARRAPGSERRRRRGAGRVPGLWSLLQPGASADPAAVAGRAGRRPDRGGAGQAALRLPGAL